MARRRLSQTSVTIWLDPEELACLDAICDSKTTRSGYAGSVLRAYLKQSMEPIFNTENQVKKEKLSEPSKIPLQPLRQDHHSPPADIQSACHTSAGHQSYTPSIDPEMIRHAIFRLRARVHNRLRRPDLSLNDLEEATCLHVQGADWLELSNRYGLETKVVERAVSDVIHEIRLMQNNLTDPHPISNRVSS